MRMDLDGGGTVCEAAWENRKVQKLAVDPIHGYIAKSLPKCMCDYDMNRMMIYKY